MTKASERAVKRLERDAKRVIKLQEQARDLFKQMDVLTDRIIRTVNMDRNPIHGAIHLADSEEGQIVLVDNYTDKDGLAKNVAFRPAAVRRFEVVEKEIK